MPEPKVVTETKIVKPTIMIADHPDPLEFAETQFKLMMDSDANFGFPKTIKYESRNESKLEKEIKNNPNTMDFLKGFSNNGKVLQAYISHNNLDNEDAELSIYNDKSFVSPELA